MHLLWVEDEQQLLKEGIRYLEAEGYFVTAVGTCHAAWNVLLKEQIDLVLLDWLLPDRPGIDLCKQIQQTYGIPVIMITAKTDEFDKVLALELGADDYISKPFGMRELTARIRAVLRRLEKSTINFSATTAGIPESIQEPEMAVHPAAGSVLRRGELVIDADQHLVYKREEAVTLTRTEFALLHVMASYPGRVFSRLQLMDEALGDAYIGYDRTIDSHIRNLRKKIEDQPDSPRYIATVHGIGYKFVKD